MRAQTKPTSKFTATVIGNPIAYSDLKPIHNPLKFHALLVDELRDIKDLEFIW